MCVEVLVGLVLFPHLDSELGLDMSCSQLNLVGRGSYCRLEAAAAPPVSVRLLYSQSALLS